MIKTRTNNVADKRSVKQGDGTWISSTSSLQRINVAIQLKTDRENIAGRTHSCSDGATTRKEDLESGLRDCRLEALRRKLGWLSDWESAKSRERKDRNCWSS